MASPRDPHSILNRGQTGGMRPPKPKVARYRPGKGPAAQNEPLSDEEEDNNIFPDAIDHFTINSDRKSVASMARSTSRTTEIEEEPARPRRQIQRTVVVEGEENEGKKSPPVVRERSRDESKVRRRVVEETIVENNAPEKSEVIEEVVQRRRGNIRERIEQEEVTKADDPIFHKLKGDDDDEEVERRMKSESEEDDEEEEEEDEDDYNRPQPIKMLKPVYVHKHERESQQEKIDEEILQQEEEEKIRRRKKEETQALFLEVIRKDDTFENEAKNKHLEEAMPPDDDDLDDPNEYQAWKIRELKRIKRDKEERYKREKERAEIERRRNLTDQERLEENKKLGSDDTNKIVKRQMNFMQKYHHKGAFVRDPDDPLFRRDINAPTALDSFDKSVLPSVLQVRTGDFGKRGRSKWTHLTAEDTTNFDPMWKVNEVIAEKTMSRMAGLNQASIVDRPTHKRK